MGKDGSIDKGNIKDLKRKMNNLHYYMQRFEV